MDITKASGKKERFDPEKFKKSLQRAGANATTIDQLLHAIEKDPSLRTTRGIYSFALAQLHAQNPAVATRYNIKRALYELGPAGFPFEQFIAALFQEQGYAVKTDQTLQGRCVAHELDVIARNDDSLEYIECKFHSRQGLICDIKVPLYVHSRIQDIINASEKKLYPYPHGWVATNTRFSSEAITYAECIGLSLLGWSYPQGNSLPELIERYNVHPITALVSLTHRQKRLLMQKGLVLCRDVAQHTHLLRELGISPLAITGIVAEANLCSQPANN